MKSLKSLYREAHLTKTVVKINNRYLYDKSKKKIIDLSKVNPNLIIIGSQKCGTTSLHQYLNEHPDIFMSSPMKEPGYFIFEEWAKSYWAEKSINVKDKKEMLVKYMLKGYAGQKYFGESSIYYTQDERETIFGIPQKIYAEVKQPKLIYIIRNPLDRIRSVYYHIRKYSDYKGSIEDMISEDNSSINTSFYFKRIEPYLKAFDKNAIKVVQFDALVKHPQEVMTDLYKFLDLPNFEHSEFKVFNKTSPNNNLTIPIEKYSDFMKQINEQKRILEEIFEITINWNLT